MSLERHKPAGAAESLRSALESSKPAGRGRVVGADVLSLLRFKRAEIASLEDAMKRRSAAAMPKFIETARPATRRGRRPSARRSRLP